MRIITTIQLLHLREGAQVQRCKVGGSPPMVVSSAGVAACVAGQPPPPDPLPEGGAGEFACVAGHAFTPALRRSHAS